MWLDLVINFGFGVAGFVFVIVLIFGMAVATGTEIGKDIFFTILFIVAITLVGTIIRLALDTEYAKKIEKAPVAQWQRQLIQNQSSVSSSLTRSTKT